MSGIRNYLVVEPDRAYARLLKSALADVGELHLVESAQAAIDWLDESDHKVDAVVMELLLGDRSGVEIVHELRSHYDWLHLPVIIHTRVKFAAIFRTKEWQASYGIVRVVEKGSASLDRLRDAMLTKPQL
jgi:CheY-like chemotaxis protein